MYICNAQVKKLPEYHQECIEMLMEGDWEVIEQLLGLKQGTLNHPRIVRDRYREAKNFTDCKHALATIFLEAIFPPMRWQ